MGQGGISGQRRHVGRDRTGSERPFVGPKALLQMVLPVFQKSSVFFDASFLCQADWVIFFVRELVAMPRYKAHEISSPQSPPACNQVTSWPWRHDQKFRHARVQLRTIVQAEKKTTKSVRGCEGAGSNHFAVASSNLDAFCL